MNTNKMTLVSSWTPPPGSQRKMQRKTFVSNNNYNTGVKTPSAETKALELLRTTGFKNIQQLDWVAKNDEGNWVVFEVKEKELFTPGKNFPHYGAGLNKSQLYLRTQLLKDLGWRTYLLIFVPGRNDVYGAYLDELEKGEFYDTPSSIRIYDIENFCRMEYNDG